MTEKSFMLKTIIDIHFFIPYATTINISHRFVLGTLEKLLFLSSFLVRRAEQSTCRDTRFHQWGLSPAVAGWRPVVCWQSEQATDGGNRDSR